jgi:hypothetical protein
MIIKKFETTKKKMKHNISNTFDYINELFINAILIITYRWSKV